MANIKSAKKRILQNERCREENSYVKHTIATLTKNYRAVLANGNIDEAEKKLTDLISHIDSACSKGVLHRNNASRKIGRLTSALFNAKFNKKEEPKVETKAKAKVEEVKEVKEEAPAKKATTKTTTAKTTAKKTTTKKEAK